MPHIVGSDEVVTFIKAHDQGDILVLCADARWLLELARAATFNADSILRATKDTIVQSTPDADRTIRFTTFGSDLHGMQADHVLMVVADEVAYMWRLAHMIERAPNA